MVVSENTDMMSAAVNSLPASQSTSPSRCSTNPITRPSRRRPSFRTGLSSGRWRRCSIMLRPITGCRLPLEKCSQYR